MTGEEHMKIRLQTTIEVTPKQIKLLKAEALEAGHSDSGTDRAIVIEYLLEELQTFASYVEERERNECDA